MRSLKFINSKEKNKILAMLKEQFGFDNKLDYAFIISQKNKIYLISKDIEKVDFEKIRINNIGLYFAELKNNNIRLSIEGSQLIGPYANKNVVELNEKQLKTWIQGIDIDTKDINIADKGYVILKHNKDFVGCGKIIDDKILNFVPKNRRLRAINY